MVEGYTIIVTFANFVIVRIVLGVDVRLPELLTLLALQLAGELTSDFLSLYLERAYSEIPDYRGWLHSNRSSLLVCCMFSALASTSVMMSTMWAIVSTT